MSFIPSFKIGNTVTHNQIIDEFQCGNMGGMRRSKTTNTLVLISDHTKGLYDDKWYNDILHYTGMGKIGDQDINFSQNKTLTQSNTNGVDVHLFEVLVPHNYIYLGPVKLCGEPYKEEQTDDDNNLRSVWMFPLCIKEGDILIDEEAFSKYEAISENKAKTLSLEKLKQRAHENQSSKVASRSVKSEAYIRNPYVAEYTKRIAKGFCQLCDQEAPFKDTKDNPYLETHHIKWLSEGGEDTLENTTALCPNCHRKMHILNQKADIEILKKKALAGVSYESVCSSN